jgi:diketogulonate reductase-like aldo/keto reductase
MPGPVVPTVALPGGVDLPRLGLGTYRLTGRAGRTAVGHALATGYRHLDTATMYGNEADIGGALRDSGLGRDEVVITTKLWPDDAGRPRAALDRSLAQLGLDHVDLWLIHWPPAGAARPDVWAELLGARDDGRARAVGVSNYSVAQIDELVAATGEAPAVNQIPWDPGRHDPGVLAAHAERGVVVESWSPLRGFSLRDRTVTAIAGRLGATPAQVVLAWNLAHGIVVIPKSATPARQAENLDAVGVTLSAEDVAAIDALAG